MSQHDSISIIIPTLNEEQNIAALLQSLRSFGKNEFQRCEIIVVDGGSTDQTVDLSSAADHVLISPAGRAAQQNAGVAKSTGDILLFLHADCTIQSDGLTAIRKLLATPKPSSISKYIAGCFKQQIDHPAKKYRYLEWGNRQRVRWLQSAYGDQGLFMTRKIFEQAGRFPDVPFLEDLLLMKKVRRLGKIGVLNEQIKISPRRWQKTGVVRQTIVNQFFVAAAHLGVSPHKLAKYYPSVR